MKILISGSHGLVGSALRAYWLARGHEIVALVRQTPGPGEVFWNPERRVIDVAHLEGFDAAVNLAGDNIATGRWNHDKKARIYDSRIVSTEVLCRALADTSRRPSVLLSASAVGYYGDCGDAVLDEHSSPGDSFLAEVCCDWESSTRAAHDAGIRVARLRMGVVLSRRGGTLRQLLPLFRLGLGGRLGSGDQYMSWISLDDLVRVMDYVVTHPHVDGAVNAVAPNPVTNREFTRALGGALWRPTLFPVPAWVLRAATGEMADELLLSSARVVPKRLQENGFRFTDPELKPALRRMLARRQLPPPIPSTNGGDPET